MVGEGTCGQTAVRIPITKSIESSNDSRKRFLIAIKFLCLELGHLGILRLLLLSPHEARSIFRERSVPIKKRFASKLIFAMSARLQPADGA